MASQKKQLQVEQLSNLLTTSLNFALVTFEKTKHQALEELRRELKKNQAKLTVVKNSLFEKTINRLSQSFHHLSDLRKKVFPLRENTAIIALGKEWHKGLKSFYEYAQKEKTLSFKASFLDELVYLKQETDTIAQLPSREQLIAKLITGMKNPLTGFNYTLKYNMQKLVFVLKERAKQNAK